MSSKGNLYPRVKAVWRREQSLRLAEGFLALLRWGLSLFVAGVLVDWLIKLPAPGRVIIVLVILGCSFYKAWRAGWKYLRPFNATRTALQIEEHRGGMQSLLVTALQLSNPAMRHGTSDKLCDLTCQRAEASADTIKPRDAMRFSSLRRPAVMALGVVLLLGILSLVYGPILMAGIGRIFTPWLSIEYPTRTHVELAQGDIVVQEGKPVLIKAGISGVIPRKAKLYLRTGKSRARIRKLTIEDKSCEYAIDTAFRSFQYRLKAGDDSTKWQKVEVIPPPGIERAQLRLEYPKYTERPPETVEALTITVPETTKVHWTLTLDRPVREAKMILSEKDSIPMSISEDGLTVSLEQEAAASRAYGFAWVDRDHGFPFTSASHYLQVAPDRPPSVELTSPSRNVYATLGRKLDLAFRARDDHGVAETVIDYRVDKIEKVRTPFTPKKPVDGTEQVIDWDYRNVLTNLVVGQSITFAVEVADRYPGVNGPHKVCSEARRIQFMSREDYLAQVEKQRKRLLSRLRTIYREERKVHELVIRLDPEDPVFIQTCQLEAVRQDLMRDRVNRLADQMRDLVNDVAANSITNETITASLESMRGDLLTISSKNLTKSASSLRSLAGQEKGKDKGRLAAKANAARMVDSSARELGLLVLHLSFIDASDVMARELHAAAETQASLRLRTTMLDGGDDHLAGDQEHLSKWLTRLFAASPKGRESTVEEALIEFTLSRMVKALVHGGIDERLQKAAALVRDGKSEEAARLQAEVISALLRAEFRLRVGAEREALVKARDIFESEVDELRKLRAEMKALDAKLFGRRRKEYANVQNDIHRKLQLLLMPEIPARRTRLFDLVVPSPPPVVDLLGTADVAMTQAEDAISAGDRDVAEKAQIRAEESFERLVAIVTERVETMSQAIRIGRLAYEVSDMQDRLDRFLERQLSLLEKTEDAAADKTKSDYLAEQEEGLADAVQELQDDLVRQMNEAATKSEHSPAVIARVGDVTDSMHKAVPLLKSNKPAEASPLEEAVVKALEQTEELLQEHSESIKSYAVAVDMTDKAVRPSPYIMEIEQEQRDMLGAARKMKPEELPQLAIPQKNLIHAVNAVLSALDPVSHMVHSGTVMLFAKEDMNSAGTALAQKDSVEAFDAQEYIVESLGDLRKKLAAVIPQYRYILEVVEALHESTQEGILIREAQRSLREELSAGADPKALGKKQAALRTRALDYAGLMNRIAGLGLIEGATKHMADAESALVGADKPSAVTAMQEVESAIRADAETVAEVRGLFPQLVAAPLPGQIDRPEVVLVKQVLEMAARHKVMLRDSCAVKPNQLKEFEAKLSEFAKACDPFIAQARTHKNPPPEDTITKKGKGAPTPAVVPAKPLPPANLHLKLVKAKEHLSKAAAAAKAADRAKFVSEQEAASDALRHFIVEYTLKFVSPPPGPAPGDPVPTDDFNETDDLMNLFMPGAVTGVKPPDGKLEWEVLGKRDRAALNENFARELPLEYRAILKNYYERLAR